MSYQRVIVNSYLRPSEVRLAFKKKSYSNHPDRHPGNPAAFTNFINVNEAFVEITRDFESRAMQSGSEVKINSPTCYDCPLLRTQM